MGDRIQQRGQPSATASGESTINFSQMKRQDYSGETGAYRSILCHHEPTSSVAISPPLGRGNLCRGLSSSTFQIAEEDNACKSASMKENFLKLAPGVETAPTKPRVPDRSRENPTRLQRDNMNCPARRECSSFDDKNAERSRAREAIVSSKRKPLASARSWSSAVPQPPPRMSTARSINKASTPTQARRKMVPLTRAPSHRSNLLQRSCSFRSTNGSVYSLDTTNGHAAGDELVSLGGISQKTEDDETTEIGTVHTAHPNVIAIGIISQNPKPAPIKSLEQEDRELASEMVARDIAQKEHNLKALRNEMGQRRAPPVQRTGSMVDEKREARLSFTTPLGLQESASDDLQDSKSPHHHRHSEHCEHTAGEFINPKFSHTELPKAVPPVQTPRVRNRKSAVQPTSGLNSFDRNQKVHAARASMHETNRLGPPPKSHSISSCSPPSIPVRTYSSGTENTGAIPTTVNVEDTEDQFSEDEQTAPKPRSLRSMASTGSGLDLDEQTRNKIVARASSSHLANRRSSRFTMNEKAVERTSLRSLRSMVSAASSTRSSEEFAHEESATAAGVPTTSVASLPPNRVRPSDNKQDLNISTGPPAANAVPTTSRPSVEKSDYRPTAAATRPGAEAVLASVAEREQREQRKLQRPGISLATGDASERQVEQDNALPFDPVTTSDVSTDQDRGNEREDLEAQAGIPVALPGAFAIQPVSSPEMVQPSSGYDSGFEDASTSSSTPEVCDEVPEEPEEAPALRPVVSDAPVEAELYEVNYADAQVLDEDDGEKEVNKRVRSAQVFLCFLVLAIATGVSLSVVYTGKGRSQPGTVCEAPCIPEVQGWTQVGGMLIGPTDRDNIEFGYSIAMSGDGTRLAVGLPGMDAGTGDDTKRLGGSTFIMDFNGTEWNKIHQVDGLAVGAESGTTVAISEDGSRVAIGAPGNGGYVALHDESPSGEWELAGPVLSGEDLDGIAFGSSLGLSSDGSTLIVGDKKAVGGTVRVFDLTNSTWSQLGQDLHGQNEGDNFGWSLGISGDGNRIVASAIAAQDLDGLVRVFDFDSSAWVQKGELLRGGDREKFGASVALADNGATLAVGATGYSKGGREFGVGRVYTYQFDGVGNQWSNKGSPIDGVSEFDKFGTSLAMSATGDTLAIGGPENDLFGDNAGHVAILRFDGSEWTPVGSQLGSVENSGGQFGFSIALSSDGKRVAGAAPESKFDGFRSKVGQAWVYDEVIE